jgi:hypothetical protein
MKPYDRSSKWLLDHHADSLLRLAGIDRVESWRALPAEVVQPRQLPDSILEVQMPGQTEPDLFIIEIATYPERRVTEQVLRGALLLYLDRRILPEVLILVLQPKGKYRVPGSESIASRLGWTGFAIRWRVVELWTVPASQLLATRDVGLVPWVTLCRLDEPADVVFQECRRRIESQATTEERENLMAVTQVLARLRYNWSELSTFFGGPQAMIESPAILELLADNGQKYLLKNLQARFGTLPADLLQAIKALTNIDQLDHLHEFAITCANLDVFRAEMVSSMPPPEPPADDE